MSYAHGFGRGAKPEGLIFFGIFVIWMVWGATDEQFTSHGGHEGGGGGGTRNYRSSLHSFSFAMIGMSRT
jgi:hypothetical protein